MVLGIVIDDLTVTLTGAFVSILLGILSWFIVRLINKLETSIDVLNNYIKDIRDILDKHKEGIITNALDTKGLKLDVDSINEVIDNINDTIQELDKRINSIEVFCKIQHKK